MNILRSALANPVAVLVAVMLALIFGVLSGYRLPVQLTPEVETPEITIKTQWRASAPEEVEAEIIEPQEKVLRGLPGMTDMVAKAQAGSGEITVTFAVNMDLSRALLEVMNRLNRVPFYPEDAEEPVLSSAGGNARPIAWFIVKPKEGNTREIASYQDFVEEVIQSRFERVRGVARSDVFGGREREVRVTFDPHKVAAMGIEIPKIASYAGSSKDISAGDADVGKRSFTLRFAGRYPVDELGEMILEWRDGRPVLLKDVADVKIEMVDRSRFVIQNGEPAIAVNASRETGVNVLQVMEGLREAAAELEAGPLARANLSFEQVYDETLYIDRSVELVTSNLAIGILLAIGVLWWFLRQLRATLLVAVAIPISLICSFVVLDYFGRTLNVISLAGMAFAVGMVLDAAIVVLENVVRLRERGMTIGQAAFQGTNQVWGALLASTVTTVAIFLPVVFLKEEAGQMFADLALTIAVAVIFSLIVAITVLPTGAQQWLGKKSFKDPHGKWWDRVTRWLMALTNTGWRRSFWISGLIALPLAAGVYFMPKADYLPQGNQNLVFAFILPPPGTNMDTIEKEMGAVVAERMQPYIDGEKLPQVMNYFFVAVGKSVFMGVRAVDPERTGELVPLINRVIGGFPDTLAFAKRTSLFGNFGGGRTIDVDIQGRNIESLLIAAQTGFGMIQQVMPGSSVRPFPGLDLADPELRLVPNERRLAEVGWNRSELAGVVRALGDGQYVGDYFDGEQRLDIIVRGSSWSTPEELAATPVQTPNAGTVPLSELVTVQYTAGPEEMRRINRRRTITLQVTPPDNVPLDEAIATLREKVEPQLAALLPEDGDIRYAGTADKLSIVKEEMLGSFILAIVILYLLISALFRSFKDSLLVLLTIPLATIGGVVALAGLNMIPGVFQPMDLLTMIGFVILLGLMVNNAILLVHQTRSAEREGVVRREAVEQAIRLRLRPILMTTLTSIFGMLPLVLMPGAGSELYRGLATVIVGGMSVSTIFTLLLLPSLLRVGENKQAKVQDEMPDQQAA